MRATRLLRILEAVTHIYVVMSIVNINEKSANGRKKTRNEQTSSFNHWRSPQRLDRSTHGSSVLFLGSNIFIRRAPHISKTLQTVIPVEEHVDEVYGASYAFRWVNECGSSTRKIFYYIWQLLVRQHSLCLRVCYLSFEQRLWLWPTSASNASNGWLILWQQTPAPWVLKFCFIRIQEGYF